jgi:hypothetical protein
MVGGAVGTTAMQLHVLPRTLVIGLVASLLVAMAAIAWASWDVGGRMRRGCWRGVAIAGDDQATAGVVAKVLAILCGLMASA